MADNTGTFPRTWIFDEHGDVVEGNYVEINEGPARFDHVPIVVLELDDGERVGVWLFATVLRSAFADEVRRRPSGDFPGGVFAVPVTRNFFVSHQWLRELRRASSGPIAAVYFRVPDEERVWVGHYRHVHRWTSAAEIGSSCAVFHVW